MTFRVCLSILTVTITTACAGDGGSPGGPSSLTGVTAIGAGGTPSGPSSPTGVTAILVECPQFMESSRCTAVANFANVTDPQDVTGIATWSTSDSTIAIVNSTGLVTARRTGEVAIRASLQGMSSFAIVWASPGLGLSGTTRVLTGVIVSGSSRLQGVLLEILSGPNVGRTTTTAAGGFYLIDGLRDGPFTLRLSKPGYVTFQFTGSIPGGKERNLSLSASAQ